jgi:hypothetical protein
MIWKMIQADENQKEVQINTLQDEYESEPEDLLNPKDELKKKIVFTAYTIRNWHDETLKARKSVKEQLEEILDLGLNKYKMQVTELRELVEKIFLYHGISESWLRKLLPVKLKDISKTRISYQQKQEIEKEQQRLLQKQASQSQQESEIKEYGLSDSGVAESFSYQPAGLELKPSSSEDGQGLEIQNELGNDLLLEGSPSSSRESVRIQSELSETNKRIERLQQDVRQLSEPFVAKAYLQAAEQDIPLVARIDPVKKVITSIQVGKATRI